MFRSFLFLGAVLLASCFSGSLRAFAPSRSKQMNVKISSARRLSFSRKLLSAPSSYGYYQTNVNGALRLQGSNDSSGDETPASPIIGLAPSDQGVLGGAGTAAACVMLYSEFVLLTTGCGLPAGPFGLVGLFEGLSYLGVLGIGGFSIFTKIKTGSGLPAGPGGLLGAAEGLSYVAIAAGAVVLLLQVTNYGYIPNAVPMEGGMCS